MNMRMTKTLNKFFRWDFWVEKRVFTNCFQKKTKQKKKEKLKRKRKHELIIEKGTGSANW